MFVKVKGKKDFINTITQAIKEIDEIIKDSSGSQNEPWYWEMMGVRSSMTTAKMRHK
jgi:hypothetical protein